MKSVPTLCASAALLLASHATRAQASVPAIGDMAPELGLTKILGAATDAPPPWSDLRGNVVVIEFWATWCGACVSHVPEANALVERFADRNVRFLAITGEEEERVERFLSRRPRGGWVGLDGNDTAFGAFDPVSIPHTVIVDREGRIVASTWSDKVTAAVIERALANEPLDLPVKRTTRRAEYEGVRDMKPPAGPEVRVEPHQGERARSMIRRDWQITIGGMPRDLVLRMVYDWPASQYRSDLPESDELWSVYAAVPEARSDELLPLVKDMLEHRLAFEVITEEAEMDVIVLERIPGVAGPAVSSARESTRSVRGSWIKAVKKPIGVLADHLRRVAGDMPCVDETGLTATYDFEMEPLDRETLRQELTNLGLRVRRETRVMPFYVFRPAGHG
ncbi:MAG: redoxin domain-containing protein [Planctomycetota bacterium]